VRFGNPKTDGRVRALEEEALVELSSENLRTMTQLLDSSGFKGRNGAVCRFWRRLHQLKYPDC
jgi:negative regulator of replication initiation